MSLREEGTDTSLQVNISVESLTTGEFTEGLSLLIDFFFSSLSNPSHAYIV